MPVRSSVCAYSPSAMSGSASNSTSKYSAILPSSSSLSYGHYKPLGSGAASSASSRASFRSTPTAQLDSAASTPTRSSFASRYSWTSSSPSSYSPAGSLSATKTTASQLTNSSAGLYKAAREPAAASPSSSYTLRHYSSSGSGLKSLPGSRFSCSSSSNSLSSTAGSTHDNGYSYTSYKSPSSSTSSAYSSGTSLSSTSSALSASYALKNRRPSYTSYSTSSSLASQRSSPSEPPLPAGVPAGLINLGNTCYMNASLQALYAMEPLRELLLANTFSVSSNKELTRELADLFKLMASSSGHSQQPVTPADFKYAFSRHQSKFSGFAQQDAQEFLRYLINGVHEEFNCASARTGRPHARSAPRTSEEAWRQYRAIVDDSPLVDLLVGQLCSTITCAACGHQSHCWDPFWDLSLPLSMRRQWANSAATPTTHTGRFGSPYSGSSGHTAPVSSLRSPSSCAAHSLREVIDEFTAKETLDADERPTCDQCKRPTRSTKQISWARLPQVLILHLKKFTNDGFKLSSPDIQIDKQLTFKATTYQLKSCISHHGHSSSSGHYTSHCEYAGRWFHFDDGRVRDVTSHFDSNKLQDAYLLFYTPAHSSQSKL